MARYPTFDEYQKSGRYKDGIKRCNELLKKHSKDVQLLTVKLQLLFADGQDGQAILEQLLAVEPHIQDPAELYTIAAAVTQSQHNVWPRPRTVGPEVAKLWENAIKRSTDVSHRLELLIQRFEDAVKANYMIDAQQALIQLKALQPKHRGIYMAHAAVTQLISTSKEDMQSRLALMLAKKAVAERFDDEKDLDCRIPGQIFAIQGSTKDLEAVQGRRFAESRHVFEALRGIKKAETNGSKSPAESMGNPSTVAPSEWLSTEVACLKARFAELIEASAGLDAMLSFAANAIRLFHESMKSTSTARSRTKRDACFVAISALIRSWESSQQSSHLLICARLAETLLHLDQHIHEARLVLVYLYMRLGLGTLAIKYFDSLVIKEVQHDTVGHALYTNLSYTHPHQLSFGDKEQRNPIQRAKNAVQVYKRYEEKLAESEASVLGNGQTGMIFDLHELRDKLRSSITKRIIFLESRRQARLLHGDSSWHTKDLGPRCVDNWTKTTDNRDFAATFDYGYNVERALHGHNGSVPGKGWLLRGLAADAAWCLATSKGTDSPIDDPRELLKALESDSPDLGQLSLDDEKPPRMASSNSDHLTGDLACQVLRLALLVQAKPSADELKEGLAGVERAIQRLNIAALCETSDACAERLEDHYLFSDVLKTVEKVCDLALQADGKPCTEELQKLQRRAEDNLLALKEHAAAQSRRINAKLIRAGMERGSEQSFAALAAFGEDGLWSFCEAVAESGKDGWSGVGKLKT